ncbi:hypothetical protein [Pseudopelagicola sp. nBUS_19]|uniref:hypothetical protein n=1 Tax=Pseudopelagicola sp. nBUS_19 TaxID=3395316 RepID=UPI003EBEEA28
MDTPPINLTDNLVQYFSGQGQFESLGVGSLSTNYTWPKRGEFPSYAHLANVEKITGSKYEKNIQLKKQSAKIWNAGDKFEVANWAISTWGGIRGNKPETVESYVKAIVSGERPKQLKGVASYSKILSFMNPKEYAIYDARVAISLNAIQLLNEETSGTIFRYLPGRNKQLQKFRNLPSTKAASLSQLGWASLKKDECYSNYLTILKRVNTELRGSELYELEMSLFADAETLADMYFRRSHPRVGAP